MKGEKKERDSQKSRDGGGERRSAASQTSRRPTEGHATAKTGRSGGGVHPIPVKLAS